MNTKITFVELVDMIAEATSTSKRMCELFVRELFATVSQALIDGESVKIKGIGTFKSTSVKSRKAVNVSSGEPQEIPSHSRVTFTPDKSLAEAINQPFAQFETVFLDDAVTDDALTEIDKQYPSLFPDCEELPEPPDMPIPPAPSPDIIPAAMSIPHPVISKAPEPKPEPKPETKPEPKPEAETHPEPASEDQEAATVQHPGPAMATPIEAKPLGPLMGIPIDDPETRSEAKPAKPKPSPTPEPEEEDYFYRPAPRNTYTPTQEQITQSQTRHDYKRWGLWGLLGVLGLGLLIWLLARGGGQSEEQQEIAVADTVQVTETGELAQVTEDEQKAKDLEAEKKAQEEKAREEKAKEEKAKAEKAKAEAEKAEAERLKAEKAKAEAEKAKAEQAKTATEPAKGSHKVVTDVVTDKIVLVTLSKKYYGNPWFWVYIYDENRDLISNPNNIKPGTRVVIPPREKYGINPNDPASVKKAQRLSWEYLKDYQ